MLKIGLIQLMCFPFVFFLAESCKKSKPAVDTPPPATSFPTTPAEKTEEDLKKEAQSHEIMAQIYDYLQAQGNCNQFNHLIDQFRSRHLFVNAGYQTYQILAVTDKGFTSIPEEKKQVLRDTSRYNQGYRLEFLLHHIMVVPKRRDPRIPSKTLLGEEVYVLDDQKKVRLGSTDYKMRTQKLVSERLEVIQIDSVLYR
ncbi:MAG: hypothetical protein IPK91_16310 [Saprospiraceae bacterium]|nr:hypothetical protein [Saprospiraceae bacterium]MBK8298803.1 hypothetical protein [Saprospiraceae bacterium]